MRRIFVQFGTGYRGEDGCDVFEAGDTITGKEIEHWCQELAFEWAESYGHGSEENYEDVWWEWEDYEPEKHDMYYPGGGSFEKDLEK